MDLGQGPVRAQAVVRPMVSAAQARRQSGRSDGLTGAALTKDETLTFDRGCQKQYFYQKVGLEIFKIDINT